MRDILNEKYNITYGDVKCVKKLTLVLGAPSEEGTRYDAKQKVSKFLFPFR